jgi:predicted helicase
MKHIINKINYNLLFKRNAPSGPQGYSYVFMTNNAISEGVLGIDPNGREYIAPLYIYEDVPTLQTRNRYPNFRLEFVNNIAQCLALTFVPDHESPEAKTLKGEKLEGVFTPLDVLDYIYAVLHSPKYREKYRELLKIDFPRIPYPDDPGSFFALAAKGAELRELHLMESPRLNNLLTRFPIAGSDEVVKIEWKGPGDGESEGIGRVHINSDQYFDAVPRRAWDFWIGGYQPARKWLKDRKGRTLSSEDILHWQRIIVALAETAKIMEEIDSIFSC